MLRWYVLCNGDIGFMMKTMMKMWIRQFLWDKKGFWDFGNDKSYGCIHKMSKIKNNKQKIRNYYEKYLVSVFKVKYWKMGKKMGFCFLG